MTGRARKSDLLVKRTSVLRFEGNKGCDEVRIFVLESARIDDQCTFRASEDAEMKYNRLSLDFTPVANLLLLPP
jgi:hypothetical protein